MNSRKTVELDEIVSFLNHSLNNKKAPAKPAEL